MTESKPHRGTVTFKRLLYYGQSWSGLVDPVKNRIRYICVQKCLKRINRIERDESMLFNYLSMSNIVMFSFS